MNYFLLYEFISVFCIKIQKIGNRGNKNLISAMECCTASGQLGFPSFRKDKKRETDVHVGGIVQRENAYVSPCSNVQMKFLIDFFLNENTSRILWQLFVFAFQEKRIVSRLGLLRLAYKKWQCCALYIAVVHVSIIPCLKCMNIGLYGLGKSAMKYRTTKCKI